MQTISFKNSSTFDGEETETINTSSSRNDEMKIREKKRCFLESYKKHTITIDSTSICAICWTGYQDGGTLCSSPNKECSHVYHEDCVLPWLMKRSDCPMCRADFLSG